MFQSVDSCQPLSVPMPIMAAIVQVESHGNPYAIGVVNGSLRRQPRNLTEAQRAVALLKQQGYNYSIGAAQINKNNFDLYGIYPHTSGFDFCSNIRAGSKILAECYSRSGFDWPKAFSCYYSGNFSIGFKQGYVQKVAHAFIYRDNKVVNKKEIKEIKKVTLEQVNIINKQKEKQQENQYELQKNIVKNPIVSKNTNLFVAKNELNQAFLLEKKLRKEYDVKHKESLISSKSIALKTNKSIKASNVNNTTYISKSNSDIIQAVILDDAFVF